MDREALLKIADMYDETTIELDEPLTAGKIEIAQKRLNYNFIKAYKDLLFISDGLLLQRGDGINLGIYNLNSMLEMNLESEITEWIPATLLIIGDDGSEKFILLDKESPEGAVYILGMGNLVREDAVLLAADFAAWLTSGFELKEYPATSYPFVVYDYKADLYLVRPPLSGTKGLLYIKEILKLETPIIELGKGLRALPYRLLHSVLFDAYVKRCAEINKRENCLVFTEVDNFDTQIEMPSY